MYTVSPAGADARADPFRPDAPDGSPDAGRVRRRYGSGVLDLDGTVIDYGTGHRLGVAACIWSDYVTLPTLGALNYAPDAFARF